jgi:acyl-CoA thioester hydrolase
MITKDFSRYLSASETIRIPFHDLDPAGVVWHGRYFKYLELARCALMEDLEYSYQGMMESGYLWPVVDTRLRYIHPLLLDQEVRVSACLREWEMRLVVDYKIEDEQGRVCTRARTVQVPVDAETQELRLGSPDVLIRNVRNRLESVE